MEDIQEMKEWLLANAQQSKHPEYGEKILQALNELQSLRVENDLLKSLLSGEVKHA